MVTIERRYNGPPSSGNGGWTAGMVAATIGGSESESESESDAITVTLRTPPPLETPISIRHHDGMVTAHAPDKTLIAEARPDDVDPEPIPCIPFAAALTVSETYPGHTAHPFPTCFVCGPDRAPGDGMRLFTGRLSDIEGDTATPWIVADDVSEPMVWASLDCPGGWSVGIEARPYVLGRMTTHVEALPKPGDACVVMGRRLAVAGRKAEVAAVLYGPDGRPLAWSRAIWIAIA